MKKISEEIVDALYGKVNSIRFERGQLIHLIDEAIKLNDVVRIKDQKSE